MPGAIFGSFFSDWVGPRYALAGAVFIQGVVGFIMSGCYAQLATPAHVAAFVVVYGIFLSLGEIGPGDNIGLMAGKTSATAIRGQYYGIAAAWGKVGHLSARKSFPSLPFASNDPRSVKLHVTATSSQLFNATPPMRPVLGRIRSSSRRASASSLPSWHCSCCLILARTLSKKISSSRLIWRSTAMT
jgi:hypothetical protein